MPSRQVYFSVSMGIIIAIVILILSTRLYTSITPTPSIQDTGPGILGERALPEDADTISTIIGRETAIILIYVGYEPIAEDGGGVRFNVLSLKIFFGEGVELIIPNTFILKDTFTIGPGDKELVAAIPVYPAKITKIELTISGLQGEFDTQILTWVGDVRLEQQRPTVIELTIK